MSGDGAGGLVASRVFPLERRHRFERVRSTQELAADAAAAGCPGGSLWVAGSQTGGKGRLGRSWHSPVGGNIYVSFLFRENLPLERLPLLTLVVARGAAEGFGHLGIPVEVKWPNDLLVGQKKLAGILGMLVLKPTPAAVIGIGVNVVPLAPSAPAEVRNLGTSLVDARGGPVAYPLAWSALLEGVGHALERVRFEGLQSTIDWANRYLRPIGSRVMYERQGREITGVATGVDPDGALVVETSSGRERVTAGDIRLVGDGRQEGEG